MKPRNRVLELLSVAGDTGATSSEIGRVCWLGTYRLYRVLVALEREGFIRSDFDPGAYPRPRRYWLTTRGTPIAAADAKQMRAALEIGVRLAEDGGHAVDGDCPTCHFMREAMMALGRRNPETKPH